MPLYTQIKRNGELLTLRWGNFHVAAMALAAAFDTGEGILGDPGHIYDSHTSEDFACYPDAPFPISRGLAFHLASYPALAKTPLNEGPYTLKSRHQFRDLEDGEILSLLPGDILSAVRS